MIALLMLLACSDAREMPADAPENGKYGAEKGGDPKGGPGAEGKGGPGDDGKGGPGGDPNGAAGGDPKGGPGGGPPGGAPGEGGAGAPLPPQDGTQEPAKVVVHPDVEFQVEGGKGVKVSGSVTYTGSQKGTIRVDFLRAQDKAGFPEIVGSLTLKAPGPFSVDVPQNLGKVQIVAYVDADGNGPSDGEAAGHPPKDNYDIETDPVSGVDITLSEDAAAQKRR